MKTFRVFVSSTFSDFKEERNALQAQVFPRLKELCLRQGGFSFQAIDLRWGISREAAISQQTMKICLDEIKNCQKLSPRPNFIFLLGNRSGWHPLPHEIEAREFELVLQNCSRRGRKLLEAWYRKDLNAVPCSYVLLPRRGRYEGFEEWLSEEEEIRCVLRQAAVRAGLRDDVLVKYRASATEQEIRLGLSTPGAEDHVFGFAREVLAGHDTEIPPELERETRDLDEIGMLKAWLKERLGSNFRQYRVRYQGSHTVKDYIGELPRTFEECMALVENDTSLGHGCLLVDVWSCLARVILREIRGIKRVDDVSREAELHEGLASRRRRLFAGRHGELRQGRAYLRSDNQVPLGIIGEPGSGKTSFMAMLGKGEENAYTVHRFAGSTPGSCNTRTLLVSIVRETARLCNHGQPDVSGDVHDLAREFLEILEKISRMGIRLQIFIDGLDQLDMDQNLPSWIPGRLPSGIRMVVSAASNTRAAEFLTGRLSALGNILEIGALSASDAREMTRVFLRENSRRLTSTQEQQVLSLFASCPLPLYLELLLKEALAWKSWDKAPGEMPGTITGMAGRFLEQLASPEKHGPVLTSFIVSCIAASRHGMSEDELLDLLSADPGVMAEFIERSEHKPPEPRLPVVIWSRIYMDLRPYLAEKQWEGRRLFSFYHRVLDEAAMEAFDADRVSRAIALYFEGQETWHNNTIGNPNRRKISELPFQLMKTGDIEGLASCLGDVFFVEAACLSGEYWMEQVLDDLKKAVGCFTSGAARQKIEAMSRALVSAITTIRCRPETTLQELLNRLEWVQNPGDGMKCMLRAAERVLGARRVWLKALSPLPVNNRFFLAGIEPPHAFCKRTGTICVHRPEGEFDLINIDTGTLKGRFRAAAARAVAVSEMNDLIVLTRDGQLEWAGFNAGFRVRQDINDLLCMGMHGIVTVTEQDRLVTWNPLACGERVIDPCVPGNISVIVTGSEGILLLYHDDGLNGVLHHYRQSGGVWLRRQFNFPFRITAACLDGMDENIAWIAGLDRCIRKIDLETGKCGAELFYERAASAPVFGMVSRLTCSRDTLFMATGKGHLGRVDTGNLSIERTGAWKQENESSCLVLFQGLGRNSLLVSTHDRAWRLDQDGEAEVVFQDPLQMVGTITECVITQGGIAAAGSDLEDRLGIFRPGRAGYVEKEDVPIPTTSSSGRVTALAALPGQGVNRSDGILAGTSEGVLFSTNNNLWSNILPYRLFAEPLKNICLPDGDTIIAGTDRCRIFSFVPAREETKTVMNYSTNCTLGGICKADNSGAFLVLLSGQNDNGSGSLLFMDTADNRHEVCRIAEKVLCMSTSPETGSFCLVKPGRVEIWARQGHVDWALLHVVSTDVLMACFMDSGRCLATIHAHRPWLSIRLVHDYLPEIAATGLPAAPTAMAASGKRVVAGLEDGTVLVLRLCKLQEDTKNERLLI